MSELNDVMIDLVIIAARLVRGDAIGRIADICEKQKSVSTKKLSNELYYIENTLKDEAVYIKDIVRRIKELGHENPNPEQDSRKKR